MKKDINPTKVEDIGIAIVKETNELNAIQIAEIRHFFRLLADR